MTLAASSVVVAATENLTSCELKTKHRELWGPVLQVCIEILVWSFERNSTDNISLLDTVISMDTKLLCIP